jgi:hypothetical protein
MTRPRHAKIRRGFPLNKLPVLIAIIAMLMAEILSAV